MCVALIDTPLSSYTQDLDAIVHTLLHRGVESSAFLREVVDKAMTDMVANVSPPKALSALIAGGLK